MINSVLSSIASSETQWYWVLTSCPLHFLLMDKIYFVLSDSLGRYLSLFCFCCRHATCSLLEFFSLGQRCSHFERIQWFWLVVLLGLAGSIYCLKCLDLTSENTKLTYKLDFISSDCVYSSSVIQISFWDLLKLVVLCSSHFLDFTLWCSILVHSNSRHTSNLDWRWHSKIL